MTQIQISTRYLKLNLCHAQKITRSLLLSPSISLEKDFLLFERFFLSLNTLVQDFSLSRNFLVYNVAIYGTSRGKPTAAARIQLNYRHETLNDKCILREQRGFSHEKSRRRLSITPGIRFGSGATSPSRDSLAIETCRVVMDSDRVVRRAKIEGKEKEDENKARTARVSTCEPASNET